MALLLVLQLPAYLQPALDHNPLGTSRSTTASSYLLMETRPSGSSWGNCKGHRSKRHVTWVLQKELAGVGGVA